MTIWRTRFFYNTQPFIDFVWKTLFYFDSLVALVDVCSIHKFLSGKLTKENLYIHTYGIFVPYKLWLPSHLSFLYTHPVNVEF